VRIRFRIKWKGGKSRRLFSSFSSRKRGSSQGSESCTFAQNGMLDERKSEEKMKGGADRKRRKS
jgi:hypothetical protein